MKNSFENLFPELNTALEKAGITEPTAIQEACIPLILAGKDIVGQSETGTGKTLAYLLPLFQRIDSQKQEAQVLIICPTHELAVQVQRQIERLAEDSGLSHKSAVIIGNVNITRQIEKLKEKPQFIVGSSGRILELIRKKKINAQTIKTIVLDEADRLLDDHNRKSVEDVMKTTLKERQVLCFSATIPPLTLERIKALARDAQIIRVSEETKIASTLAHQYLLAEQRDKFEALRKLVRIINPERALVFINSSEMIEATVEKLRYHGLEAEGLHGSAIKTERGKALSDFRSGKIQLLVASDLAARGLDIQDITHIFNLDLPEDHQLYLHRAGRAGRAGQKGNVLSIVNEQELAMLVKLQSLYKIKIDSMDMYKGAVIEAKAETTKKPVQREKASSPQNRLAKGKTQNTMVQKKPRISDPSAKTNLHPVKQESRIKTDKSLKKPYRDT